MTHGKVMFCNNSQVVNVINGQRRYPEGGKATLLLRSVRKRKKDRKQRKIQEKGLKIPLGRLFLWFGMGCQIGCLTHEFSKTT